METGKIIKIEDTWHKPNEGLNLSFTPVTMKWVSRNGFRVLEPVINPTEDADFEITYPLQLPDGK